MDFGADYPEKRELEESDIPVHLAIRPPHTQVPERVTAGLKAMMLCVPDASNWLTKSDNFVLDQRTGERLGDLEPPDELDEQDEGEGMDLKK